MSRVPAFVRSYARPAALTMRGAPLTLGFCRDVFMHLARSGERRFKVPAVVRPVAWANKSAGQIEIVARADPHGIVSIAGSDWTVDRPVPIFNTKRKGARRMPTYRKTPEAVSKLT